jgi:hypothetical protein
MVTSVNFQFFNVGGGFASGTFDGIDTAADDSSLGSKGHGGFLGD